jgi:sugar (pentulose or hexulose) kinase
VFKRVAKVLLPKDYVRLMLTGDYVTDLSDASGPFGWTCNNAPGRTNYSH